MGSRVRVWEWDGAGGFFDLQTSSSSECLVSLVAFPPRSPPLASIMSHSLPTTTNPNFHPPPSPLCSPCLLCISCHPGGMRETSTSLPLYFPPIPPSSSWIPRFPSSLSISRSISFSRAGQLIGRRGRRGTKGQSSQVQEERGPRIWSSLYNCMHSGSTLSWARPSLTVRGALIPTATILLSTWIPKAA